jgi:hypothetical protein
MERFEATTAQAIIASDGQATYETLQHIYDLLRSRIDNGLDIEQAIQSFDVIIRDLEEAIKLEDDAFVNP